MHRGRADPREVGVTARQSDEQANDRRWRRSSFTQRWVATTLNTTLMQFQLTFITIQSTVIMKLADFDLKSIAT